MDIKFSLTRFVYCLLYVMLLPYKSPQANTQPLQRQHVLITSYVHTVVLCTTVLLCCHPPPCRRRDFGADSLVRFGRRGDRRAPPCRAYGATATSLPLRSISLLSFNGGESLMQVNAAVQYVGISMYVLLLGVTAVRLYHKCVHVYLLLYARIS